MKVTKIDVLPIYPKLAARYAHRMVDLFGINYRTVYRVETDNGLVGYGDQRVRPGGQPGLKSAERYVGCDPCDFIKGGEATALTGAMYDVMGKYLDVPAHKLMGPKVRDEVKVAAWTRPATPEVFRDEILRAAGQGYTVFKMHTSMYHDVYEQVRLASEVAPPHFKLHLDFNGNRSMAAVLPIIKELEREPIVGFIEDPMVRSDLDGWPKLRAKSPIPIIMHVPPLGGYQELVAGAADIYMLSGSVGKVFAQGITCGLANVQTLLQFETGTLGKAMAMHIASVLPTCEAHSVNLDDQYEEDITTKRIEIVEGYSPVPDGPGLGFEVDEEALAEFASREPPVLPRHVGTLTMPNGTVYHGPSFASPPGEEGMVRGMRHEIWEDDGSREFEKLYERVQKEGRIRGD
ncbi:MAG: hypothetical protein CMJ49_03840 [Planctomycetaceae bacterium]|nr:hypothetical protein [Planctomycetaceae bacterium]